MKQKKKKSWWKGDWWIDECGHDYRIPFVVSIIGLGCSISTILVKIFLL